MAVAVVWVPLATTNLGNGVGETMGVISDASLITEVVAPVS